MTIEYAARLEAVSLRYKKVVALDSVHLDLPRGRMIGLIGPDGVGKSSLLALISGARRIQTGSVEVLGGDMRSRQHRELVCARIAYMPQGLGRNLYPTLSVYENIDFFGRLFGLSAEARQRRIAELLEATGLGFPERAAGKLSGGMKQKLGLCCALIHDPDLLILDEPTTGVDPLSRRQFWDLIDRIRARRKEMSVLVATAYFEEAERFDSLVAMNDARVLAVDTPRGLKARTQAETLEQAFSRLLVDSTHEAPPEHRNARPIDPSVIAIEAHDLTRRFGDFVAVDHVSFRIARGEIFGFLGPNGCGKTTTMKMLTGLLSPSGGSASLFGAPVNAKDIETRRRIGFMSQSFSLYTELTVRKNLELHARLFHLPHAHAKQRIAELVGQFGLENYLDSLTEHLPLGVRQRLSLAVAIIHEPDLVILDEPTSGVDPVARDRFWALLTDLARNRGVTVFVSTHFMNEAERCDRISLMHAGRVLAQGSPAEIVKEAGAVNLEEAFIQHLRAATHSPEMAASELESPAGERIAGGARSHFSPRRLWAYARRELMEIRRDPIRLAFSMLGPILLMIVFGYGITFDIERLSYATLDQDRSPESRAYLESFASSRYFDQRRELLNDAELEKRMRSGELRLAIEIPPAFGRNLRAGRSPEVSVSIDGAFPFRAETTKGYVEAAHRLFLREAAIESNGTVTSSPLQLETRFRYNQDFRSVFAIVPGTLMLILVFMPAIATAMGVVREKELGSIINFYVTPTRKLEFLLGKQLPSVGIAYINFLTLMALALLLFQVPIKGSVAALMVGALVYVISSTGIGLLVSNFVKTQIAAITATGIITAMPAVEYSGYILPVSSLSTDARIIGSAFPSSHFFQISMGAFTKGLGFQSLLPEILALAGIVVLLTLAASAALREQEA